MTIGTSANTRTLIAYATDLLQYARWNIEREVDFTDCRHAGHYQASEAECEECPFGLACRWLDQQRTPDLDSASLDEMVEAIERACNYLESTNEHRPVDDVDWHHWIHKAHRFLRARRG